MSELQYKVYNRTSLYVTGDREKYAEVIKKLGGRWNNKLKPNPGWTVPIAKEEELKNLINGLASGAPQTTPVPSSGTRDAKDEEIERIQQHAKSRKAQHKYHRAVSESEDEESSKSENEKKEAINDSSSEDEKVSIKPVEKVVAKITKVSSKPVEKVVSKISSKPIEKVVEKKPVVVTESESESSVSEESEDESEASEASKSEEEKPVRRRGSPPVVEKRHHKKVEHLPTKRRSGYEDKKKHKHVDRPVNRLSEDRHSRHRRPSPVAEKKKRHEKRKQSYRKVYNRSESEDDSTSVTSTSSSSSSSSDDFPLPESPRKNNRIAVDYDYIQTQLKDIQARLSQKKRTLRE
jgi:hypothetical protein